MKPTTLYEIEFNDLPKSDRESLIEALRGSRTTQQWRKHCAKTLHNQMSFSCVGLEEIPRRKNGQKLGLRKRLNEAIKNNIIEIRPLGIWYL